MALFGFAFRSTASYVTDDATTYPISTSDAWPTTKTINGTNYTFGIYTPGDIYPTTPQIRDRNKSVDPRLAGNWFLSNTSPYLDLYFQMPAPGYYNLYLAGGDAQYSYVPRIQVFDHDFLLETIGDGVTSHGSGTWVDATGTERSASGWVSNNAPLTVYSSTGIIRVRVGLADGAGSGSAPISYIGFDAISPSGPQFFKANDRNFCHRNSSSERLYKGGFASAITSVTVGGTACTIVDQSADYVDVSVPAGIVAGNQAAVLSNATESATGTCVVVDNPTNVTGSVSWHPNASQLGKTLDDFFSVQVSGSAKVNQDSAGSYYAQINRLAQNSRGLIALEKLANVDLSNVSDFEMLLDFEIADTSAATQVYGRYTQDASYSSTLYMAGGGFDSSADRIFKVVGGTSGAALASKSLTPSSYVGARAFQRVSISGTTIQSTVWLAANPEPSSPDIVVTDSGISGGGGIGVYGYAEKGFRLYGAAISFDGSKAAFAVSSGTTVTPNTLNSLSAIGAPGVSQTTSVAPAGMISASAVASPTILTAVSPAPLASAGSMGAPAISQAGSVLPAALASASAMGAPAVSQTTTIAPAVLASSATMGSPGITATAPALSPAPLSSASLLGSPGVTQQSAVSPASVLSVSALGTAPIDQSGTIAPAPATSVSAVGSATIVFAGLTILPAQTASQSAMGSPTVTGVSTGSPAALTSAVSVGQALVGSVVMLAPARLVSGSVMGAPGLSASATIYPVALASPSVVGIPGITANAIGQASPMLSLSSVTSTTVVVNPVSFFPEQTTIRSLTPAYRIQSKTPNYTVKRVYHGQVH